MIDADEFEKEIRFFAKTLYQNIKHSLTKDFRPSRDFVRGVEDGYCRILSALQAQPTISLKGWIPVSERLPKVGEEVLVWRKEKDHRGINIGIASIGFHDIEDNNFEYIGKKMVWYCGIYYCDLENVTAWMPLPESYKVESEGRGYEYVFKADIDAAPTIDPVKHGRWMYVKKSDTFKCSSCGGGAIRNDYPYCMWCGVRMLNDDPSHPFADDVMMGDEAAE